MDSITATGTPTTSQLQGLEEKYQKTRQLPNPQAHDNLASALDAVSSRPSEFSLRIAAQKEAISRLVETSPESAKAHRAKRRLDAFLRKAILARAAEGNAPEALVTAAQAMANPDKDGSLSDMLKGICTVPNSSDVIEAMRLAKRERAARKRRAFVQQHMTLPSAATILRAEGHSQEQILELLPTAASLQAVRRAQKQAEAIKKHVTRIKSVRGRK